MGSLTYFNFNIVIVMVLVFFAAYSFYCGLFRSLKLFLQFFISFIVSEVLGRQLINSKDYHQFNESLLAFLTKLEKYIYIEHKNLFSIIMIYLIVFVIVFLLVHIVFMFFSPSPEERILQPPKRLSRFLSLLPGVLSAYMVSVILIFGSLNFVPMNDKGLNKAFLNNPLKITSIEKYNEFSVELESSYQRYAYNLDLVNGQVLDFELEKLYDITQKIYEVDHFFEDVVFPILESEDAKKYLNTHLPNSSLSVKGYVYALVSDVDEKKVYDLVIEKEMTNSRLELIKSVYKFTMTHQEYIKFIFEFNQEITYDNLSDLLLFINEKNINETSKELKNLITAGKFYYLHSEWFISKLSDEVISPTDLLTYKKLLTQYLFNNDKTYLLAEAYLAEYEQIKDNTSLDLSNIIEEVYSMFKFYKKVSKRINMYNHNLPLSLKLSLSKIDFDPQKNDLFDSVLIWATLNDSFMSCEKKVIDFDGSLEVCDNYYNQIALFSEYLIVSLADDYDYLTPIDHDGMAIILDRFDKFTSDKFINPQVAQQIFEALVFDQNNYSLINKLYQLDLLTTEAIEVITSSDYQFISSISKSYLKEKYLIV